MICMNCGKEARDAIPEVQYDGDPDEESAWVYCRKCDCWTEHPIEESEGETE